MPETTDPQPDRSLRAVLTVTVETRPDGGHYFDQADFTAHATEWVRAALKGQHAVDEVTIVDQAAELARAQAEAHQYRTALQGVARAAAPVPPSEPTGRTAILREAADALTRVPGYPSLVRPEQLVAELRRMAVEAPAPSRADSEGPAVRPWACAASYSGHCLAEAQSETACDTDAGECVHSGRPAAVSQPSKEA